MSWYRLYRPRTISGLHLTSVRHAFQKMMEQGKLPQVMLFAGPKGTGKTSTARIIAAMVNDAHNQAVVEGLFLGKALPKNPKLLEPDPKDKSLNSIFEGTSFLVQELDAASNRGIDDVRAIKEKVNLPPQSGLMTVYIFDEVHMLTTEAFNALLKLLEEPPAHVMFILATTELHKIPATVTSRAMLIEFTQASVAELSQALSQVLTVEAKKFEPAALDLIASAAEGSFRDAVKLAETLSAQLPELTQAEVSVALHTSLDETLKEIVLAVVNKQPAVVSQAFEELRQQQLNPDLITKKLFLLIHAALLQGLKVRVGQPFITQPIAVFLLQELQAINPNYSPIPLLPLEVKLLDLIARSQQKNAKPGASSNVSSSSPVTQGTKPVTADIKLVVAELAPPTISLEKPITVDQIQPITIVKLPGKEQTPSDNITSLAPGDSQKLLSQWEAFVDLVRAKNSSLAALLKSAQLISTDGATATIAVYYKFHQEQLQQPKFRKMIEDCVEPLTGGHIRLEFILKEPATMAPQSDIINPPEKTDLASLAEELLV